MTATYENAMQAYQQATFVMLDAKERWTEGLAGNDELQSAREAYATASAAYDAAFRLDMASRPRETRPIPGQMESM